MTNRIAKWTPYAQLAPTQQNDKARIVLGFVESVYRIHYEDARQQPVYSVRCSLAELSTAAVDVLVGNGVELTN